MFRKKRRQPTLYKKDFKNLQQYLDQVAGRSKRIEEEKIDYFQIKQQYIKHLKDIAQAHGIEIDKEDLLPFQVRT